MARGRGHQQVFRGPTEGESSTMRAPVKPWGAKARTSPSSKWILAPMAVNPFKCRSMGREPMDSLRAAPAAPPQPGPAGDPAPTPRPAWPHKGIAVAAQVRGRRPKPRTVLLRLHLHTQAAEQLQHVLHVQNARQAPKPQLLLRQQAGRQQRQRRVLALEGRSSPQSRTPPSTSKCTSSTSLALCSPRAGPPKRTVPARDGSISVGRSMGRHAPFAKGCKQASPSPARPAPTGEKLNAAAVFTPIMAFAILFCNRQSRQKRPKEVAYACPTQGRRPGPGFGRSLERACTAILSRP